MVTDSEKDYAREVHAFLLREYPPEYVNSQVIKDIRHILRCYRDNVSIADCAELLRPEQVQAISDIVDDFLRDL